jgi:hypothetical protein
MKRALFVAVAAAACAQQEGARRSSQPAATAIESGADAGVVSPGSEPHKPSATTGPRATTPAVARS